MDIGNIIVLGFKKLTDSLFVASYKQTANRFRDHTISSALTGLTKRVAKGETLPLSIMALNFDPF